MNADFLRAVVLKVAFKPEALRRAQAGYLFIALAGQSFTGDCLPAEITGDDPSLPGVAVRGLARIGLIQSLGFTRSPSKTRHGSWVQRWRLGDGKESTARTWLKRNGFDATVPHETQIELLTTPVPFPCN